MPWPVRSLAEAYTEKLKQLRQEKRFSVAKKAAAAKL